MLTSSTQVAIKHISFNADKVYQGEKEWDLEARNLELTNSVDHVNIVRFLGAIKQGEDRYFMFPWANGGSLADFWHDTPKQEPDSTIISESIKQIRGLVDALCRLHKFVPKVPTEPSNADIPEVTVEGQPIPQDESLRHGDLKPENILRFLDDAASADARNRTVGVLKMADMGLAKRHHVGTVYRKVRTSAKVSQSSCVSQPGYRHYCHR
jgi:serine/threonine protein kinase